MNISVQNIIEPIDSGQVPCFSEKSEASLAHALMQAF